MGLIENGGGGAPPRSGLVQREVDTLKRAVKGTFKVYKLALRLQCLVSMLRENTAPPNFSEKDTTQNLMSFIKRTKL